ncbi:MAG: uroporphyrinogen-III C-methyltransferase, partial [Myxococcales bacterium]|nr:uroporphyrinogen-III C-methyltransferase [Myxococcales bacterium]
MAGFVSLVGAGPWDPQLLTLAGQDRLARAQCVIADYLVNPALLLHCLPDCEIHQRSTGPSGRMDLEQAATNALMLERAQAGLRVVRLKGGDPCMFGRGGEEAQVLVAAGIEFEFVPGVSAPIAAPQYAGIAVTHRDHTPAVT